MLDKAHLRAILNPGFCLLSSGFDSTTNRRLNRSGRYSRIKKVLLMLLHKFVAHDVQLCEKLCFLHLAARQIGPYCGYSSSEHSWRRSFTGKNKPWWQSDVYVSAVNNLHEKRSLDCDGLMCVINPRRVVFLRKFFNWWLKRLLAATLVHFFHVVPGGCHGICI